MADRAARAVKENRRLVDAKIRFIYSDGNEGTIFGEWINARIAFNQGVMTPNDEYKVIGLQIDSDTNHLSERLRASDYQE